MTSPTSFSSRQLIALALMLAAGGCAWQNQGLVRVVDRSSVELLEPAPPGYYRVKRGDTLYRIALDHGQYYRDLAHWNDLADPNQIEVNQLLRVVPPPGESKPVNAASQPRAAAAPIGALPKRGGAAKPAAPAAEAAKPASAADAAPKAADAPLSAGDGTIRLGWPAKGTVLDRFDEAKNKGIDIGGKAGDPVAAAADGKVVYAGNGLRGYGNLVIIKHDSTYLTAYAHNRALTVKEGEIVHRGQKIAEMGSTDADRVKLHFEVRRNGKPVDPVKFLSGQN